VPRPPIPYADVPITPPVPLGPSPIHMKGTSFRSTTANVETYVEGGLSALLERAGDPKLRAFWSQPFLAAGWYDVFGMVALVAHAARRRGVPYFTAVADLSRMLAVSDSRGLYRALLWAASPEFLAPRLPRIQSRYMDFGGVRVGATRPGYCEIFRTEHPALLVHWYMGVVSGFVPHVLEQAGAKGPRIRWDAPVVDGVAHGFETVTVRFEINW
jgi:hypothetical protein